MKKNINKYPVVDKLPKGSLTVSEYANNKGFTTNYIYNQIKLAKEKGKESPFNIVVYQTYNFITP